MQAGDRVRERSGAQRTGRVAIVEPDDSHREGCTSTVRGKCPECGAHLHPEGRLLHVVVDDDNVKADGRDLYEPWREARCLAID